MIPASHASRWAWTAVPMAAPAVATACWLAWVEITRDPPRTTPELSLAEAIQQDQIETAWEHIRAGRDPNAPVAYRHERLTGGREIMLAPLLIAVAHARDDTVKALMSSGARLDAPGGRFAVCLAKRMEFERVAATLIRYGGAETGPTTCPDRAPPKESPLSAYVE